MKNALNIPIWFFEIFTTAKSFKGNPIIGSPILNRLGLHVFRLIFSHVVMRGRMLLLSPMISAEDRKSYFEKGYIVKEDFLSDEEFQRLEEAARSFDGEIREARQGNTLTHRAVLSPDVLENRAVLAQVVDNQKLNRLTQFASGHLRKPFYYLEEVKNQFCSGNEDPQKTFHNDTFHPSMKCWLFIDDVTPETGPFTFVPESHKLSWKRIKWQYQMSLVASNDKNGYHAKGSTRYLEEDLKELGLPEPKPFTVKKNTLVIVNVFGIHRRGNSEKSTRLALWGDSRTNPFIPFPGIGGKFANQIQYYFLGLYRKKMDDAAAARGHRSPWHIIETDEK
ncbi:phytanoyl-CoA dioxygenase family protein [Cocleimonas sp. KMM 6892]|uniref:phytanoyl-CoA dioxygenase family protein n=1 Tax=unclassified Cocleimonas TaxID=2639732 RepID=UPI002DB9517A|nr:MULTISPECIES: phytanoyl-CoA dioxygenase family protein [unclassified Cocleimonas]MEB8432469.1 phytanoyl-CoA dioxygenase family protein [Cocleimonas sp. KMM 6892]MEC4715328.1 phytanoyl-CoA dioxygenase family protein [Cocleimonas sp. KMM 6895]MEC4745053.1 phytanoyl-CoA dioxygenase family protein [Cocleimonas sp. KMM 6896]